MSRQYRARASSKFLAAAEARIGKTLTYDPAYTSLAYLDGDVPVERGVCSDVAIRAFRGVGFDLQKEIHEDMKRAFSAYPRNWSLRKPDANIDHRRVLNLMTFFKHRGKSLPVTQNAADYQPGDLRHARPAGADPHPARVALRRGRAARARLAPG